jgi:transcriptional repressor NrdR
VKVIKKSGDREEYDRSKLEKSFNIACKKRPIPEEKIQQAIHSIEEKISNISNIEIEANQIGELVMEELRDIDKVAFIRFASVYRQFKDIGEFQAQIEDLRD